MTQRWLGGYITNNPTEPTSSVAKGVWSAAEQLVHHAAGNWPKTIRTPDEISGMEFWYKSDTGVTKDGSNNVSAWADQSGNGRNLSEATNQPLWVDATLNGYPVIRFDGSNDKLTSADFTLAQPFHWFVVVNLVSAPSVAGAVIYGDNDASNSTTPPQFQFSSAPNARIVANGLVGATQLVGTASFKLYECYFSGTSSTMLINGTQYTDTDDLSGSMDGIVLGSRNTGAFGNIEIAEVIGYNAAITDPNLNGLRYHLRTKYAIF